MSAKLVQAIEALLAVAMAEASPAAATPARSGNRTPARTDYRGGDVQQDLADVARRFVRLSREGTKASAKERNIARKVLKAFKARYGVANTNGVDVFTHAGA